MIFSPGALSIATGDFAPEWVAATEDKLLASLLAGLL
jgi:hypothetical protein